MAYTKNSQIVERIPWPHRLLMSVKLIHVLSSFHMLFIAFYIYIHIKLITFPLNLV